MAGFLCCFWTGLCSLVHVCVSVFTDKLGIHRCFDPPQLWMFNKSKSKQKRNMWQYSSPQYCIRAFLQYHWGQSSKVLKGGDAMAPLIRLETKSVYSYSHGGRTVGFAATVYVPAQISLRNATIHVCLVSKAPAIVWRGEKFSLSCNAFFCPSYKLFFSIFILHNSIIIKRLFCFCFNICTRMLFFIKCVLPSPFRKCQGFLPLFTVGCREIAAALLPDGGTCLIVGGGFEGGGHSFKEYVATAASKWFCRETGRIFGFHCCGERACVDV